jgi:flagellar basal-body rod protein FlgG
MLTGFFTSANAMDAFQTSLDNTSNNLANVNTTAFKRTVTNFEDLIYSGDVNHQIGNGIRIASITPTGFQQGTFMSTGNPTDMMIDGKGFYQIQVEDGSIMYSRDGAFHRDPSNRLVNNAGFPLQPPITLPSDTLSITISAGGTVSVLTSSSPSTPKVIGQIQLASFPNQESLKLEAGNLYSQTVDSGPPSVGTPGTGGLGRIQQGGLEQSNVDVTTELTSLLTAQQGFTANSKVVTTTNSMLVSTLQMIQ